MGNVLWPEGVMSYSGCRRLAPMGPASEGDRIREAMAAARRRHGLRRAWLLGGLQAAAALLLTWLMLGWRA